MSDLAEPRTNRLLVLAQAAMEVQKKQVDQVDDENNHKSKSTSPRKTPVIVSSHEAKRWPNVVSEFGDLLRVKHITNLEEHDKSKHLDQLALASATPATVLKHAVDITKKLKAIKEAKITELNNTRRINEKHQDKINRMEKEIRRAIPEKADTELKLAKMTVEHEDEKKTMARERLRDRTYSESFTSHRPPKCKPGRPRPRNGEQPSTNKVPISIDAATLPWLKRRSNFNDFSQPSKQKKTCQDTNTEGLKNRPI